MSKPLSILAGLLVIQILIFALVSSDSSSEIKKYSFLSMDTTQIDYIKIRNEHGEMTLNKVGVNWYIKEPVDYLANRDYMNQLMNRLGSLVVEANVTSNASRFQLYELDDLAAKYVEVGKQGGKIDKFYTGKSNESYTHTYMRHADSKDVLLVTGTPGVTFTRRPEDWRDKSIWAIDRASVQRIVLKHQNQIIELNRNIFVNDGEQSAPNDTTWLTKVGEKPEFVADDKAINRIFNTLRRFNTSHFRDKGRDEIPSFENPFFRIEVYLDGGYTESMDFLQIGNEEDPDQWLARKNNDDTTIFVIFQSSVNNLMRTEDQLRGIEEQAKPAS